MFEQEIYPEIYDKAAVYMFNIISNHVFQDGNKRTGLEAALLFLKLNKCSLQEELAKIKLENKIIPKTGDTSNEILYDFTIEIASGKLTLEECRNWFKENIKM
ncbi:MAG: type II toxin-antitoxin system death-on-curing family toxin [Lewinellaceae bacterium]|nr:type II toxin-antitoxin system death-on-curing family toxin [Lewinellaceae bacterium]